MVTAQDVLEYISEAGPVLPKHVAEAFGISTLFASAFLSELSGNNAVLTSHLKIGGSPLYYTPEHRDRLVDYRGNLHEKEQKTFALLRSEQILDDSELELLDRVALRKMEDFAVPLAVDVGGSRKIFWKYYLLSDEQSARIIGEMLERAATPQTSEPQQEPGEDASEEASVPVQEHTTPTEPPAQDSVGAREGASEQMASGLPRETREAHVHPDPSGSEETRTPPDAVRGSGAVSKTRERQSKITITPEHVTQAPEASEILSQDPLGKRVYEHLSKNGIRIIEADVPRKNSCLGVCSVPSPIGELDYYFFAKEKKSITDKDIKEAFAEATLLGYPLLYIASGEVKKSASDLFEKKIKGSLMIVI